MKKETREEVLLDAALDAARRETAEGLDAMRAQVVFRNIRTELAPKEKKRWLLPVIALGATAGAAFVALISYLANPARFDGKPTIIEQPLAQVVYRSGDLPSDAVEIAPTDRIDVATDARLDFVVPKKVRVAVHGPASVARKADGSIALSAGRASFAVDPHPKDSPFKVRARDAEVIVHGTKFDVEVKDGLLAQVRVKEGKVEVKKLDGSPSVFLLGGALLHAEDASTMTSTEANFDAPWWKTRHEENASEGYLSVESKPSGARVMLDGEPIGRTPLLVLWTGGPRELRISHAGYHPFTASASIQAGKIERVSARLEPLPALPALPAMAVEEPAPAKTVKDPWKIARAMLEAKKCKQLDKVIEGLTDRASSDVDKARAEMLAAECQLRSGAKARALEAYTHVHDAYAATQSAEAALFEAAKLEGELGKTPESLGHLEAYLAKYSTSGRFAEAATMRRCEILAEMKQLGEARGCLENYRRVFPEAIRTQQAVLLLATIARVETRWAAAVDLYAEYLEHSADASHTEDAAYHRLECMKRGNIDGLEPLVADFLARWPNTAHAPEVAKWKR